MTGEHEHTVLAVVWGGGLGSLFFLLGICLAIVTCYLFSSTDPES